MNDSILMPQIDGESVPKELSDSNQKSLKINREGSRKVNCEPDPKEFDTDLESTEEKSQKQDKESDKLISKLYKGSEEKRVKRNEYVHKPSGILISSWRMNEWDYKKYRTPTLARGLFTRETGDTKEIVIRGYDKFFNIDEVPETKWENIITQTQGPYEITVKENGCIIFISGLPGDFIIVTSKHSMGQRDDGPAHAVIGEQWLDKHLEKIGKNKQDLAKFLFQNKLTAVAELCDDLFEEHVLPYTHDNRGLYLHGVNHNTADLRTWPINMVANFAKEWGFKPIKYYIKQTVEEVKSFTDDVKEKGLLDDRPIEGFVIRTKTGSTGQDFFFKIKYDEPYLMYREWREITKALLSKRKPRSTYELSRKYIEWVTEKIKTQPKLFEEYKKNRGIFLVREMFLEHLNNKGDVQTVEKIPQEQTKTLLIPVATIGCGKTTLSLALVKLFSFGHIQNDNITGKKARIEFHGNINKELNSRNVVIADRNNHIKELRKTLIEAVKPNFSNIRIVAIYWNHEDHNKNEIFNVTSKRVISRGENHQSLTPENPLYEQIMWKFLNEFQRLDSNNKVDDQFDHVIDLDIENDIKTNLEIVINELIPIIGIKKPSKDAIEKALEEINDYRPTVRKIVSNKKSVVDYYGINLDFDAQGFLTTFYNKHPNEESLTFKKLIQENRINNAHHITLIHSKDLQEDPSDRNKELWKKYEAMYKDLLQVKIYIGKIVFDSKIMAFVVKRIDPSDIYSTNKIMHVTVGTVDNSVKHFQANKLCELALSGIHEENKSEIHVINLENELEVKGTIKAYMKIAK